MSVPTTWYADINGSDLNSGGSAATTAPFSSASMSVSGTTGTVASGLNAIGSDALGINIQVSGNSEIRGYTVVNDTTLTLSSAPSAGDGTYAVKIGGARKTIKKVVQTGTDQNARFATDNIVNVAAGTYTENAITPAARCIIQGSGVRPTIDGTGGAGGSHILTPGTAGTQIINIGFANAVARGFSPSQYCSVTKCVASACGTIGILTLMNATGTPGTLGWYSYCAARTCTTNGFQAFDQSATNGSGTLAFCEASSNTGIGFGAMGCTTLFNCLSYTNAGGGYTAAPSVAGIILVLGNCTFDNNTGPGVSVTVTNYVAGYVVNCAFTNNSTYGFSASGAFPTSGFFDYNLYNGNTTAARNNGITGSHDSTAAPGYTGTPDYTPLSTGGLYKAGYSEFTGNNKLNIGAVPGIGSAQVVGGGGGSMLYGFGI